MNEKFNRKPNKDFKSTKKSNTSKTDKKKSGFDRYRDESAPSDFGKAKTRPSTSGSKENRNHSKPAFKSDRRTEKSTEKFGKSKPNFKKDNFKKEKPNENDDLYFDDSESKPKSSSFGKPYKKKPFIKKRSSVNTISEKKAVDDGTVRLNKYISNAGICSRREADDLISSGVIQVNGKTITELGYKVKPTDVIKYGGQTLKKEKMVYLILNKPKDYITTFDDPQQRKTVLELIQGACKERVYPVGRLDRATTGLLLFTNDGDLTKKLTHPKYGVRKIYHVELDKALKRTDFDKIAEGIELEDGPIKVDEISYVADGSNKKEIGIELHSGKNRIVRRIFEHFGYNVRKLDRVILGPLSKKDLPRGRWRLLTDAEVGMLKMISSE